LLLPGQSFAELWQFTPSITLEERYDDNIRLTTGPHDDVTGTLLKGSVRFSRASETGGLSGTLRVNLNDYSGDEVDSDIKHNVFFDFASHTSTERSRLALAGTLKQDTTARSIDFEEVGDDIDEGLVDVDIRRNKLNVTPSFQYNLSERTSLDLSYYFYDVRHEDNPVGSGLFDYDQHSITGTINRKLSERDTLIAAAGVSKFRSPDNNDIETDSYELTAGFMRQFSEITVGEMLVGVRKAESESAIQTSDDTGFVLRLKLVHDTETDKYEVGIAHDLQPSSSGALEEANTFTFNAARKLTELLKGSVRVRWHETETLTTNSRTRRFLSIKPRLDWRLTRWWSLGAGYIYRQKEDSSGSVDAESNAVFVSIRYRKPTDLE